MNIHIITTTTSRPWCFGMLRKYVQSNGVAATWHVVGEDHDAYDFSPMPGINFDIIRRSKHVDEVLPSLNMNWLELLETFTMGDDDLAVVMEDDDYYSSDYIKRFIEMAYSKKNLLGFTHDLYYHVKQRRCQRMHNHHCSLAATAFRSPVLPFIKELAKENSVFIDWSLWNRWNQDDQFKWMNDQRTPQHVGMKGCPGLVGCGAFHTKQLGGPDPQGKQLVDWIGKELALQYFRA